MDLEQLEQSLLEGARRDLAPSASDRLRIQSALSRGGAWWQSAAPRASGLRKLTRSFRGGMALGLAFGTVIGAVVGVGASGGLGRWGAAAAPHSPVVSQSPSLPVAAPIEPAPRALGQVPPAEAAADVPIAEVASSSNAGRDPSEVPRAGRNAGLGSVPRRAAEPAAAHTPRSSLAEELSLLARARRALTRSDAPMALGIVESLDERFPNGVLMEERTATRILCLCELGRKDEAQLHARRFLALHPASVYAERVRSSCAGGQ